MWYLITIITLVVITALSGMFCAASLYSSLFIKRDYRYATMSFAIGAFCIFLLVIELKLLTMI
jgi:hypothetical protein